MNIFRHFRSRRSLAAGFASVTVLVSAFAVACSGSGAYGSAGPTNTPMPTGTATSNVKASLAVGTRQSMLGEFLTAPNGMTLYVFARDSANTSNCTGDCLVTWPPLLAQNGQAIEGSGNANGKFDLISTPSGTQVTYNSAPLYFYLGDGNPGDTKGEGIGGVWSVAKAMQQSSTAAPAAAATPATRNSAPAAAQQPAVAPPPAAAPPVTAPPVAAPSPMAPAMAAPTATKAAPTPRPTVAPAQPPVGGNGYGY